MESKILLKNILKIGMVLLGQCYAVQLWPMLDSRVSSMGSFGPDEERSFTDSQAFFLDAEISLSALQGALLDYKLIFKDGHYSQEMEERLSGSYKPLPSYPLPKKYADEIKRIIGQRLGVATDKLRACDIARINDHKQKVYDYYLDHKYHKKRLAVFGDIVWQIASNISALAMEHVGRGGLMAKAIAMEREEYDDSASLVLNWFLDICKELKNRIYPAQDAAPSSATSSSTSNP